VPRRFEAAAEGREFKDWRIRRFYAQKEEDWVPARMQAVRCRNQGQMENEKDGRRADAEYRSGPSEQSKLPDDKNIYPPDSKIK